MKFRFNFWEKRLVILFLIVAAVMGYIQLRLRPAQRELKRLSGENLKKQEEIRSFKPAHEARDDMDYLRAQIGDIDKQIAIQEKRRDELGKKFAPLDSPEHLQQLKVEISSLARANHVIITENLPYEGHSLLERPMRKITARAVFYDLFNFMNELRKLRWNATIGQLTIEAVEQSQRRPNAQTLQVNLVLIL